MKPIKSKVLIFLFLILIFFTFLRVFTLVISAQVVFILEVCFLQVLFLFFQNLLGFFPFLIWIHLLNFQVFLKGNFPSFFVPRLSLSNNPYLFSPHVLQYFLSDFKIYHSLYYTLLSFNPFNHLIKPKHVIFKPKIQIPQLICPIT